MSKDPFTHKWFVTLRLASGQYQSWAERTEELKVWSFRALRCRFDISDELQPERAKENKYINSQIYTANDFLSAVLCCGVFWFIDLFSVSVKVPEFWTQSLLLLLFYASVFCIGSI